MVERKIEVDAFARNHNDVVSLKRNVWRLAGKHIETQELVAKVRQRLAAAAEGG